MAKLFACFSSWFSRGTKEHDMKSSSFEFSLKDRGDSAEPSTPTIAAGREQQLLTPGSVGTPISPGSSFVINDGLTVGISNSVKKYAVDQPIRLQLAPYEERLAKALEKEEVARRKAEEKKNKAKKT